MTSNIRLTMLAATLSLFSGTVRAQLGPVEQQPLVNGRFAVGIDYNIENGSAATDFSMYEGRIQINKPGLFNFGQTCVGGYGDFDIRPVAGLRKIREVLSEEVNEAIETEIRLRTSDAMAKLGKTISPDDVVIPPGRLEEKIENFSAPEEGYHGKGVVGYAKHITRASAVTDATLRQTYLHFTFSGCQRKVGDKESLEIVFGKVNPVHFNSNTTFHPFISRPTARAIINFYREGFVKRVSLYTEVSSDRGGVISKAGDAAGMVLNLVKRGKDPLTYKPDTIETGTQVELALARVIAAVSRRNGDQLAYVVSVNNEGYDSENTIGLSGQIVIQRSRGANGKDQKLTMTDLMFKRTLGESVYIWGERFERKGYEDSRNQFLRSWSLGGEVNVAENLLGLPISTDIGSQIYWNKNAHPVYPNVYQNDKGAAAYTRLSF
jgi:hypothetical protein